MSINVLVVDDSRVMRAMILKSLELAGLPIDQTYQATNGKEGLEVLKQHGIDLVIVDVNMPIMNGEEMLDAMIKTPGLQNIPVLVISTESSVTRTTRLREKGAAFIHKPFKPETIRDTVKHIMEGK
ncbi:response regulator [Desulfobacterales bacterium HSG16]|nr:response regulator [Desulfobacterales bacterium HSG16]